MASAADHTDDLAAIREAVRALCADFPGDYWRKLDRERAYPGEFVAALTQAGFLAALIPEEYGGSGLNMPAAAAIMEEIHASGCNGAACHAQMYTMGTLLRHGSAAQKEKYLPAIARGELRLQAFGVTEPTSGTDTLSLRTTAARDGNARYIVNGQKIWTSRAEHSDLLLLLARTTPREVTKCTWRSSTSSSTAASAVAARGPSSWAARLIAAATSARPASAADRFARILPSSPAASCAGRAAPTSGGDRRAEPPRRASTIDHARAALATLFDSAAERRWRVAAGALGARTHY